MNVTFPVLLCCYIVVAVIAYRGEIATRCIRDNALSAHPCRVSARENEDALWRAGLWPMIMVADLLQKMTKENVRP